MSLNYYKTKTDQKRKWCISPSSLGLSAKNAILIREMVVIENVVVALKIEYDFRKDYDLGFNHKRFPCKL